MQDDLLNTTEAADLLGLAKSTLNKWRVVKTDGPKFTRIGRCIRYRRSDLAEYVAANMHRCTAGYLDQRA